MKWSYREQVGGPIKEIEAPSEQEARKKLSEMGVNPTSIWERKETVRISLPLPPKLTQSTVGGGTTLSTPPTPPPPTTPPPPQPPPSNEESLPEGLGLGLTLLLGIICSGIIILVVLNFSGVWHPAILMAIPVLVFADGWVKIPPGHRGIVFLFGRPTGIILGMGLNWAPPIISQTVTVDCRQRRNEYGSRDKFLLSTLDGNQTEKSTKAEMVMVQMKARVTILWRIFNLKKFVQIGITFKDGVPLEDLSVINDAIADIVIKSLRQLGAKRSDVQLLASQDTFEDELREEVLNETLNVLSIWGLKVDKVMLPKIEHDDPVIVKAYHDRRKEEQESNAEKIEMEFVEKAIRQLTNTGLSPMEAARIVQAERGKARRIDVTTDAGSNALPVAAALIADALRDGGKK